MIIISVVKNVDSLTPVESLKESDPEAFKKGYARFLIDGQEAVSSNTQDWITVNTPDNKYTISISLLAGKDVIMFTEWGIVQESFKFLR